ncbi:MAG: hypothetical protein FWE67_06865 [Planctomycetaceae bacterium]|nr:hypothetical protein [Planctomycetaceae bacterium]
MTVIQCTPQSGGKSGVQQISVKALAPLVSDKDWQLPRIRLASPNVFWTETRCDIFVHKYLRVKKMECIDGVQTVSAPFNQTSRETFTFQYFQPDAANIVYLSRQEPAALVNSTAQILCSDTEITCNMTLDCSVKDGELYVFQFPVSKEWAVNTVKAVSEDVISWDVIRTPNHPVSDRILTVQINRAIRPKTPPLRIQVLGRYISPQNDTFHLGDFIPLIIPIVPEQTQIVALLLETAKQLKCLSPEISLQEISIPGNSPLYRQFSAMQSTMPRGNLFLLNTKTKNVLFRMEQLNPVYSGEIDASFLLRENRITAAYQFRCNPADSKIDKVYVFFNPSAKNKFALNWNTDSELLPIQARELSDKELDEILSQSLTKLPAAQAAQGTVWEIRFPSSPSSSFTFRADAAADIHDLMRLPLAALPFAVQQKGGVRVISPRATNYQIVNSRLTTVPLPSPKEDEYQIIRAAFRYSPMEEFRRQETSPLMLKQVPASDLPPSSWVWLQRNSRRYESSGFLNNNTLFFLENRGKENLRITLPNNVSHENILAVRIGEERAVWYPVLNKNADEGDVITVPLPERQRFVCIALEYSQQTKPQLKQKSNPSNQPVPDVPVIESEKILWYPPELDVTVYDRDELRQSGSSFGDSFFVSKAAAYQLPDSNFRPLAFSFWYELFTEDIHRKEAVQAAKTFLRFLEITAATLNETSAEGGMPKAEAEFNWITLQKKERLLSEMLADESIQSTKAGKRKDSPPFFKIMIDKPAFHYYGISPKSPVLIEGSLANFNGNDVLEQNHLLLFVAVNYNSGGVPEYTFYLTSVLTAAMNKYFDSKPIGNNIRFMPDSKKILPNSSARAAAKISLQNEQNISAVMSRSDWITLNDWTQKSAEAVFPWKVPLHQIEPYSDAANWFAAEIPTDKIVTIFIARRVVTNAEYFLAFLAALALTWKRPFSSPLFMLLLLLLCEIAARELPACYTGIPSGCFLGILVSFGFVLIRKRAGKKKSALVHRPVDDDSQEYEVSVEPQSHEEKKENVEALSAGTLLHRYIHSENKNGGKPPLIFWLFFTLGITALGITVCSCTTSFGAETVTGKDTQPVSPADLPDKNKPPEPFRVFYPTDGVQKVVENFVWIPERFYQYLHKNTQRKPAGQQYNWSIERAEYIGVLTTATLSGDLNVSEFKAVYEIILNENKANIILPPLPLLQDGATWDSMPIQPIWEINKTQNGKEPSTAAPFSVAENTQQKERLLAFNIENERKGRHRLELLLDIKSVSADMLRKVCFDIPKVPNAVLTLTVPINAPEINITNCCGSISFSDSALQYEAQIGPSDKCSFSWSDIQYGGAPATIEADTLFKLRTRPLQLRAKFRCRIDGRKVNFINLMTDPNWQLSGQYHCEEFPIEHIETYSIAGKDSADSQQKITRLVFKTPVSGSVTIQAGFVLKDFSGIGNIGLPQIRLADAKTGKAMLAVLDSPSLDIDIPKESLTSGFDSLWSAKSGSGPSETADTREITPATSADAPAEHKLAVYDLTATPPSWTLSLKTKKETPTLSLQHFCCFDLGGTNLVTNASLHSNSDVFQQRFSIPHSVQINAVNVYDSLNNPVDCTWSSIPGTPETPDEKYTVFFKRPLSGQYQMSIGTFIPTAEVTVDPKTKAQDLPLLTFDNVELTEEKLYFYRTISVIADLFVPQTGWKKQEEKPATPPKFADAVFLSSWLKQMESTADNTSAQPDNTHPDRLSAHVSPNRPSVRSETITALYRDTATDSWSIVYDILWNISQGELSEIRYLWDERCGTILSVEPAVQFNLEQKERSLQLVIRREELSAEKFTGRVHLRIKTVLNTADGIISVPKIQPVLEDSIRFNNKNYVVLPRQSSDIAIPWNYSSLTPVDTNSIEHLKNLIFSRFDEVSSEVVSSSGVLIQPVLDVRREIRPETTLSAIFSPFSATGTEVFRDNRLPADAVFLQATSDDFTCSITQKNERPAATLYDIRYSVSDSGALFGVLTADIKSLGNDSCILTLPPNSELLQIASSGVCSEGIRLMDRRWKISLFSSSYPQRIIVVFRCRQPKDKPQDTKQFLSAVLPVFENVDIQGTLWSFSFSPAASLRKRTERRIQTENLLFDISVIQEKTVAADTLSLPLKTEDIAEHFNGQRLLSGADRSQTLLKLNLVRLNNLLFLMDSLPKPVLGQTDEFRNWAGEWNSVWGGLAAQINGLRIEYPNAILAEGLAVIHTKLEENELFPARKRNISEMLEAMNPADKSLQALLLRKKYLTTNPSPRTELNQVYLTPSALFPQNIVGNETYGEIFGTANGNIKEIRLTQQIPSTDWFSTLLFQSITGGIFFVLLIILLSKLQFSNLLLQFPHFWGIIAGVLLWCFIYMEIAAAAVIGLSLLSLFFRPLTSPAQTNG